MNHDLLQHYPIMLLPSNLKLKQHYSTRRGKECHSILHLCTLSWTSQPFIYVKTCLLAPQHQTGRPVKIDCRTRWNQEGKTIQRLIQEVKHKFMWGSQTRYSSNQNRPRTRKIRATQGNRKREGSEGAASIPHELVQRESSPTVVQHWIWGLLLVVPSQSKTKEM